MSMSILVGDALSLKVVCTANGSIQCEVFAQKPTLQWMSNQACCVGWEVYQQRTGDAARPAT